MTTKYKSSLQNQSITFKDCVVPPDMQNKYRHKRWNLAGVSLYQVIGWAIVAALGITGMLLLINTIRGEVTITFKLNDCNISCHQNLPFKAKVKNLDSNFKRRHPNAYIELSTRSGRQMDKPYTYARGTKAGRSANDNETSEQRSLLAKILQ